MKAKPRPLRKRILRRSGMVFASTVGPWLLRVLARTWRVRRIGAADTVDSRRPLTYGLWHESIPAGAALHRRRDLTVMISSHHDGELITRIVESLGFRTVRGSSTRGGSRALRQMLKAAKDAEGLVVTPDGPRGPAHSIASGVLFVAAATGRPLVATGFAASRAWRAGSWDRMIIPKPFSKVVVGYAGDLEVPRAAIRDQALLEVHRGRFARRFADAHATAA
ncbi:MAG: lysophospholipid acyltransferase family protein, partial [Planctomycetes bacterium]|nr:lysophospholipid acyltransferase family protein [Planctomycetota bacterium]